MEKKNISLIQVTEKKKSFISSRMTTKNYILAKVVMNITQKDI